MFFFQKLTCRLSFQEDLNIEQLESAHHVRISDRISKQRIVIKWSEMGSSYNGLAGFLNHQQSHTQQNLPRWWFPTQLEKYESKWVKFFPNFPGENKKSLKPPTKPTGKKATLPKLNMEPKNFGFQKESPIPGCHFQVPWEGTQPNSKTPRNRHPPRVEILVPIPALHLPSLSFLGGNAHPPGPVIIS